jgi:acetate kinase
MSAPAVPDAALLVLNSGSSSIKFALFDAGAAAVAQPGALPRQPWWGGKLQGIGGDAPQLVCSGAPAQAVALQASDAYADGLQRIVAEAHQRLGAVPLRAVVHRVVHGGEHFQAPLWLTPKQLAALRALEPLAPLHQPYALDAAQALFEQQPGLPQLACFDTAFHHTLPLAETLLPLPRALRARGLRRYGFHGLSYEYQALTLPQQHGALAQGRCVVAHLGSGASLCALQGGRSVATTMGFSALDGLMMGTRCGALDPGVLLYLLQQEGLDAAQLARLLYQHSGLLGTSGRSAEPRVLLACEAEDADAAAALALYEQRIVREIGALVALLGGLDLLVFTAGVGENSAEIRRRVVARLGFVGAALDEAANARHDPVISTPASAVRVAVAPANEEWVMALHALRQLATG